MPLYAVSAQGKNHIDVFLRTQKLLEDIYRSAALHREIAAETEEAL